MKITVGGVNADGAPRHDEWTGKFDGKDYPVSGNSDEDTRALKKVKTHLHPHVKERRPDDGDGAHCDRSGREDTHGDDDAHWSEREEDHQQAVYDNK